MTAILGISAFYHDSAAALVVDGQIVAAAQEERFTRKKHDAAFPRHAIDFCLQSASLQPKDLDYVGFYEKPLTKFERILETYLAFAPRGYRSFRLALPSWLKQKLHSTREITEGLPGYTRRIAYLDHHQSHAASAFFPSPFTDAAILTIDGVGEWSSACIGVGQENKIELHHEIRFPHSLGLLYSAFTYYTGFRVNSGEYKLMGLAPFGEPTFKERILEHLVDLKPDGSLRMDMSYFNYCQGLTMTNAKFHKLFGGPPRNPESPLTQRHADLAASIQSVTEQAVLNMVRFAHQTTGMSNLVLAGGVALNCVANGRIQREGPFENIWIQPAAGDAGGALGTALFLCHQMLDEPRTRTSTDSQHGSLLGPAFSDQDIRNALDPQQAVYSSFDNDEQLCYATAQLIADQKVVGWFQGRMEFGPRALGSRSILADARSATMQSTLNQKIKFRESFRPFAPIVLAERASDYFEIGHHLSPYMMLVAPVQPQHRLSPANSVPPRLDTLTAHSPRSTIPAVTHVDYSARLQTVDEQQNPLLHQLLATFDRLTGCPLMINTSFNVRGEPIVCKPIDAYRCFMLTDMDALVIGRHLLLKEKQPQRVAPQDRQSHLQQFALD